jgi:copper chaperone CopZ
METTVKISGMTCGHCEGRVSSELGKIAGVTNVKAVASDGLALITSESPIDAGLISQAVHVAGYKVI